MNEEQLLKARETVFKYTYGDKVKIKDYDFDCLIFNRYPVEDKHLDVFLPYYDVVQVRKDKDDLQEFFYQQGIHESLIE